MKRTEQGTCERPKEHEQEHGQLHTNNQKRPATQNERNITRCERSTHTKQTENSTIKERA